MNVPVALWRMHLEMQSETKRVYCRDYDDVGFFVCTVTQALNQRYRSGNDIIQ